MTMGIWIPLISGLTAVIMAAGILGRDPGQRANRLVALILACSAHWSLCEVLWNSSDDPDVVLWLVRLSGAGWLWLGPLALELYVELAGDSRSSLRKLIPYAYGSSAFSLALYATPWGVIEPVRTDFGWGYSFGPLFPIVYLPTIFFVSLVLSRWRGLFPHGVSPGERREARWLFFGIGVPMTVASTTDVLLPMLGHNVPRLGSASMVVVGAVVAWSIRRHGYFLLAPGAFTHEILETLRDGVALVAPDGRIRSTNGALRKLAERTSNELDGSRIEELISPRGGDPGEPGGPNSDAELHTGSGRPIPVAIASSRLHNHYRDLIGEVLVVRDLREVTSLRNRLVTSGRLAAVGELAAGIAHEINNPITFVRANLAHLTQLWQTLIDEAEKTERASVLSPALEEGGELLEESIEGIDRIAAVVRDVGAISHEGLQELEQVDINELLENAVNVAALSFSVLVERCYADLPVVRCNPQQLKQVFLNLLLNALQAVGDYGQIRLATEVSDRGVIVTVEDDGCGIDEQTVGRIFDPFFTTRPAGEGTGMGLALSYQIVRNHGGEICVDSVRGVGTSVRIELPAGEA